MYANLLFLLLLQAYNQITSIPIEMGNLAKLEVVNFSKWWALRAHIFRDFDLLY